MGVAMEFKVGMIVKSIAGHDKGRFYVILKMDGNRAQIADGKLRKIEKPKSKNFIHLARSSKIVDLNSFKTNKSLRVFLNSYNFCN